MISEVSITVSNGEMTCNYCGEKARSIQGVFSNVGEFCVRHYYCKGKKKKELEAAKLLSFLEYVENSHAITYNWNEKEIKKLVKEYVEAE